ncbi:tetratricopeptide repeat protein [Hydrogenimonas thermophila]|uniref:tetratricopeptide repeat protein n=1 Tax=Hydrogenimonas thermophila TaxID=223786 RepID=UPI00293736A5|nr:tetratricopeptide repeat protein [Hydrogenimonas thermophila]WOE70882.1 tetratricopeptide repeat protein [Hydrogenimonas thermophila]WOE73400.1 tetratricopeptide repeat protein [Hydrogenimonas thermophila]
MSKTVFLLSVSILSAFASMQEPSAFGAGDLDAPNPYGLSSTEKHIVKNQKDIKRLQNILMKQQSVSEENRERLDGIQSILETLNKQVRSIENRLNRVSDVNKSISSLNKRVDALEQTQSENFEKIRTVLKELSSMLDSINEKYVDKEQFAALEKSFLAFKSSYEKFIKKGDLSGKPNSQVYKEAKKKFAKKQYSEAAIYFEHLIKNHYKPAASNYYLGEIAYRQGRYKDAVAYYKQSASLYDKSSYMPALLLHTAISLGRLGKKREAKTFYETLIDLYPNSKSAAVARKNLKKLK